jgi:hypothetical protein
MVGDGRESLRHRMLPDFVTPGGITKKLKAKCLEFFNNLPVLKTGKAAHAD